MRRDLALAAYLAVSWTWCIGMYLPVLLTRDFDTPGWLVFALPNVIGAAAMGWVLRSREASVAFVERNRDACRVFSWVTIAYQLFFAAWFLPGMLGSQVAMLVVAALVAVICWPAWRAISLPAVGVIAVIGLLLSLVAFGILMPTELNRRPHWPMSWDLLGVAISSMLGFALCPYLDLTFHEVRQNATRPRLAFGVGFGAFFLAMITFTLWYAPAVGERDRVSDTSRLIGAHIALQLLLTVAMHTRALSIWNQTITDRRRMKEILITTVAALALAALASAGRELRVLELSIGELIYRGILGFYGLSFPAYVLLMARPGSRRPWELYGITVVTALPLFAVGFFLRQEAWLIAGVAVVLFAALMGRQMSRRLPTGSLPQS